jgi:uncharacterized membrane protein YeaQ/YmgE (transglycosylase-associated protein family)
LNDVLTLGAGVGIVGALLALWLVRDREIEREPQGRPLELVPATVADKASPSGPRR